MEKRTKAMENIEKFRERQFKEAPPLAETSYPESIYETLSAKTDAVSVYRNLYMKMVSKCQLMEKDIADLTHQNNALIQTINDISATIRKSYQHQQQWTRE